MFCTSCGHENKDTAVFCRKCGEATGVEVETRVAARPVDAPSITADDDTPEASIFSIGPTMMFVKAGYIATAIAALLIVAIASAFLGTWVSPVIGVVLGLALFVIPAVYHVKQKLVRYTLTDTKLEIDEGLISRTTRSVPLRRVQDVTVSTSIMQRLLGYGDVVIENANEDGGRVVLKNINSPRQTADTLMRQMRRLEGQDRQR